MELFSQLRSWLVTAVAGVVLLLPFGSSADAGQLVLRNTSAAPIACTVDGWTTASGGRFDWTIQVQPGTPFYVGQNTSRPGPAVINWARCGALTTRSMTITPTGPTQSLVLNGQQTRVLNASLYPYLPTLPSDDFENLVNHVVETYQGQNPDVLLNAVLNQQVNIYSFDELPTLLGSQGFDTMELDMLYLGFLVSNGLINQSTITGEPPVKVAIGGASLNGQLWGIPSWLCLDFIYSADPALRNQGTLAQLDAYLAKMPSSKTALVGDFNGSWRLPSIYINAYVQAYGGYKSISQSLQMPPDQAVIGNLVGLTDYCLRSGANHCTNGTYHGGGNGTTEQVFASGDASNDMGFSEQSFFINLYGPVSPLYIMPAQWGATPQPLLFEDAFVTNSTTCSAATPCAADAVSFINLMTSLTMKNYIVQSKDLPANTPWRTLLVANDSFWNQPIIIDHPLYQQYKPALANGRPFPNTFTAALQSAMGTQICNALKQKQPSYVCKSSQATLKTIPSNSNLTPVNSTVRTPLPTPNSRRGL